MIIKLAISRHCMKCKRGGDCPWRSCARTPESKKRVSKTILPDSTLHKDYLKCRGSNRSVFRKSNGERFECFCKEVRAVMKRRKTRHFPDSPMKLQLLAACAVSRNARLEACPHREELLRLKNSAVRIQRRWRAFLRARGYFKTRLCKFHMGGGCRRGLDCTFAHGRDDLRYNFNDWCNIALSGLNYKNL